MTGPTSAIPWMTSPKKQVRRPLTDELIEGLMDEDHSLMQVGESNFVVPLPDLVGFVVFLLM